MTANGALIAVNGPEKVNTRERYEFFQSLPLFRGLPDDQLVALAGNAEARTFAAGQAIVDESDEVRAFFILARGRAKLFKILADGKDQTIYIFGPGEPFCLCSTFAEKRYPASAAALEDSTILALPRQTLELAAQQTPDLLFNMVLLLSRRLKDAMERIESLSTRDSGQRLALFLLRMGAPVRTGDRVSLPLSHRELAKIVGLTPEALSRTFRRLAEAGLVTVNNREIVLRDLPRLEALACSEDSWDQDDGTRPPRTRAANSAGGNGLLK